MAQSSLRQYLQALVNFDRSQLALLPGLRKSLVVTVLLAAAVATGQIYIGFMLVLGAFSVGFVDQGGSYLPRLRAMLLACLVIGVSALVGVLVSSIDWLFVLLMALWGFVAGMLVALGPAALVIGLQAVVALSISSNFHLPPLLALETGGLLMVGGLLQTAVALAPWPFSYYRYEREALARAYQAQAALAEQLSDAARGLRASEALAQAGRTLANSVPRFSSGPAGETFRALLDKGWGITEELIALAELRGRLAAQKRQSQTLRHLDELTRAASALLSALADSLAAHRLLPDLDGPVHQMQQALKVLRCDQPGESPADAIEQGTLAAALERAGALNGQVRSALAVCSDWLKTGESRAKEDGTRRPFALQPQSPQAILRANLTLQSMVFRHALRLSLILAVAAILYKTLPLQRGYWIPLTVVVVLRPDFTTTLTRGLVLGAGTLLGAALVDLLIAAVHPGPWGLVVLVALLTFAALAVFQASFALYAVLLTGYIVSLVELAGTPPLTAAVARAENTLIGAGLAMAVIVLWPAWERMQVPQHLADLLEAEGRYITLILSGYLNPPTLDPARVRRCRLKTRLARSNAEASVQRSLAEPKRFRTNARVALGVLANDVHLFYVTLALEAVFWHTRPNRPLPCLRPLIDALQTAVRSLTRALRFETPVGRWPDLRAAHRALVEWGEGAEPLDREDHARLTYVIAETERLIESVCTMRQLLAQDRARSGEPADEGTSEPALAG
ncbi:MAG TPA: FUSC family protein [Ktedonobacterales bacterium]